MSPMLLLIALLGGGTCFLIVAVLFAPKHDVHKRLAELEESFGVEARSGEDVLFRLLAADSRSKLERRLQEAGWSNVKPNVIVLQSVIGVAVGIGLALALIVIWGAVDFVPLVGGLVLVVGCGYFPTYRLNAAIESRKKKIHRELPDFLDIVSTTVEAGIALNGAIAIAVDALSGPFGDELRIALSDIRLGRSRVEALAAMAKRIQESDVTTMVTAMVQAEKLGGNIASVLFELAQDARERRLMRAEELAGQLPVKMTFPMVFFMLPSLLLMIFGSVLADYLHR